MEAQLLMEYNTQQLSSRELSLILMQLLSSSLLLLEDDPNCCLTSIIVSLKAESPLGETGSVCFNNDARRTARVVR